MQSNARQQMDGHGSGVSDWAWSAEAWWNPWCGLGAPTVSVNPTIVPVSGAVALPTVYPIAHPHFSAMVISCTWLLHTGPSSSCFPHAQQYCCSCSLRTQEPTFSLSRARVPPNLHSDPTAPFDHEYTGWGDMSRLDFGPWPDPAWTGYESQALWMEEPGAHFATAEAPKYDNDPLKRQS